MVASFCAYQTYYDYMEWGPETFEDATELAHSSTYGGSGGSSFAHSPSGEMTQILIRYGSRIDKVGFTAGGRSYSYGGGGGRQETINTKGLCIN